LEEFRVRRFAVIQEEIRSRASWRWSMLESKWVGRKERKSLVSSAYRWWFREQEEMRVLRGVVYMTKSSGPRTEPYKVVHHNPLWNAQIAVFDNKSSLTFVVANKQNGVCYDPASVRVIHSAVINRLNVPSRNEHCTNGKSVIFRHQSYSRNSIYQPIETLNIGA